MTIGTGIVIAIAILCVTFLITLGIGYKAMKIKAQSAETLAAEILKKRNKI